MTILLNQTYLNSAANQTLWEKVLEGFKYISGDGWESRANYEQSWTLVRHLYKLAKGKKAKLPMELYAGPLGFMFAGHAGRIRKGIRKRPYFHHIVMVVYVGWVIGLSDEEILALIHHDDIEDIPEHLDVSRSWVEKAIRWHSGTEPLATVINLTNAEYPPGGKHASQLEKMAKIPQKDGTGKLIDKFCNLYDLRYDRPTNKTHNEVRQDCINALELAAAMPVPAKEEVLILLHFILQMMVRENNFNPA